MKKQLHIVGCFVIIFAIMMLTACKGDTPIKDSDIDNTISYEEEDSISDNNSDDVFQSANEVFADSKDTEQEKSGLNIGPASQVSKPDTDNIQNEHIHTWSSKNVAPTCTAEGYILKTCVCGATEKGSLVSALGHSWGEWTTIKEASQTATGLKRRTCLSCGAREEKMLEKLPQASENYYQEILKLVNIERANNNLSPLEYYYAGQSAADIRAKEIKTQFSHTRPNGTSCFTVFEELNINYRSAGENIAYGYMSPEAVMQGWMNSEGHRKNILNANFTHIIVGIDGNHWVQLFLKL